MRPLGGPRRDVIFAVLSPKPLQSTPIVLMAFLRSPHVSVKLKCCFVLLLCAGLKAPLCVNKGMGTDRVRTVKCPARVRLVSSAANAIKKSE